MRFKALSIILFLLLLTFFSSAVSAQEQASGELNVIHLKTMPFDQWAAVDRDYIKGLTDNPGAIKKEEVFKEYQSILQAITKIVLEGGRLEAKTGARIYGPQDTGRLMILQAAKKSRENLLRELSKGNPQTSFELIYSNPYLLSGELTESGTDTVLESVPGDKQIDFEQAKEILSGMDILNNALSGYNIFLVPYKIVGFGGYSFSQGLEQLEESSFITTATDIKVVKASLVHEIGHFIHHQLIGEYQQNAAAWAEYLQERGNKQWVDQNSWSENTVENFAEDFRVLFGPDAARAVSYQGKYGDPTKSRKLNAEIGQYFIDTVQEKDIPQVDYRDFALFNSGRLQTVSLNGLEFGNSLTLDDSNPRIEIRGVAYISDKAVQKPVALLVKDNFQKEQRLEIGPDGSYSVEFTLPGKGSYELILGTSQNNRINVFKSISLDLLELGAAAAVAEESKAAARITRGEFISALIGSRSGSGIVVFDDVPAGDSSFSAISAAVEAGMIDPYRSVNGLFRPQDFLTQGEIYEMISYIISNKLPSQWNPYVLGIAESREISQESTPVSKNQAVAAINRLKLLTGL